jgi:hypothetical protein
MQALIAWILTTPPSKLMTGYAWAWPMAETLHFIGLTLMAGTVGAFDLRLLGVARGIAPAALHRLIPWGVGGFGLAALTGLLFISGAPDQYFYNDAFKLKVVCLLLMGLNVGLFYLLEFRALRALGPHDDAPPAARAMAGASLLLLVAVMCCGRMLTFFRPAVVY